MGPWASDPKVLQRMREVVMAVNRLEHRSSRAEVSDRELMQLRRELAQAADAYEEAISSLGWQVPSPRVGV